MQNFQHKITSIWFSYALFDIEFKCKYASATQVMVRIVYIFPEGIFQQRINCSTFIFVRSRCDRCKSKNTRNLVFYEIKETAVTYVIDFRCHYYAKLMPEERKIRFYFHTERANI